MKIDYKTTLLFCFLGLSTPVLYAQEHFQDTTIQLGQQYIADQIVAVVGSTMITLSEMDLAQQMIEQGYKERGYTGESSLAEALEALLIQKVLASQAAVDSLPVNQSGIDLEAQKQMQSMVKDFGGIAQVEALTNTPIFKVESNLKKRLETQQLATAMQNKIQENITITPAEVTRLYRKMPKDSLPIIPEQFIYAQIAKVPPKNDDVARMNVKGELLALRDRIVKGANFAALARMYSEDYTSAPRGGEMDPMPKESFTPNFADALTQLKPGQISEVIETPYGFHIIELLDVQGNLYHCRHILMKVKFSAEQKVAAIQQLDSVLNQIRKDSLTFEKAVELYSTDENSKQNQGVVLNTWYERYGGGARAKTNRFNKEELGYDYNYIQSLKEGEMSEVFEAIDINTGDDIIKFIKLIKVIPSHVANLREDYVALEGEALEMKKQEAFDEWIDNKIGEMYIRIEEPYKSLMAKYAEKWVK